MHMYSDERQPCGSMLLKIFFMWVLRSGFQVFSIEILVMVIPSFLNGKNIKLFL